MSIKRLIVIAASIPMIRACSSLSKGCCRGIKTATPVLIHVVWQSRSGGNSSTINHRLRHDQPPTPTAGIQPAQPLNYIMPFFGQYSRVFFAFCCSFFFRNLLSATYEILRLASIFLSHFANIPKTLNQFPNHKPL